MVFLTSFLLLNPLNPKIQNWILICCLYSFHYRSSGEKLRKYQANSSCVLMSIILMTTLFYKALILQGEIWCWSLLGINGLTLIHWIMQSNFWTTRLAELFPRGVDLIKGHNFHSLFTLALLHSLSNLFPLALTLVRAPCPSQLPRQCHL